MAERPLVGGLPGGGLNQQQLIKLLSQGAPTQNKLNAQSKLAQGLLQTSQSTSSPLVAALSGFLGQTELQNLADKQGDIDKASMARLLEDRAFSREDKEFARGLSTRGLDLQEMQIEASRDNARATRQASQQNLLLKKLEKEQEKEEKATVAGFEFADPSITPQPKSAEALREANKVALQMKAAVGRIRNNMKEVGTEAFDWVGNESKLLASDYSRLIVLQNKLAGLGALVGADLDLLKAVIPDPTAGFSSGATVLKEFDQFEKNITTDLGLIAQSGGFKPEGSSSKPGAVINFEDLPE